jgi:hypothetical protein
VVELNEYECEMLDAVLEAFGIPDSLTRNQLLTLFDQDEASAFALVQILIREGLVAETGKHGDYDLPEKLVLKLKGDKFLKAGGFLKRYQAYKLIIMENESNDISKCPFLQRRT